jgi:hypothetical protein
VAVVLRLGEELSVDVVESGLEIGGLETVGDVTALARQLSLLPREPATAI